jgi:hypothetical protein
MLHYNTPDNSSSETEEEIIGILLPTYVNVQRGYEHLVPEGYKRNEEIPIDEFGLEHVVLVAKIIGDIDEFFDAENDSGLYFSELSDNASPRFDEAKKQLATKYGVPDNVFDVIMMCGIEQVSVPPGRSVDVTFVVDNDDE